MGPDELNEWRYRVVGFVPSYMGEDGVWHEGFNFTQYVAAMNDEEVTHTVADFKERFPTAQVHAEKTRDHWEWV